jgi:surface protein
MAKYIVPSRAASGAQTFSDSLVGNQITDGTSQLTNSNFALDKVIPEKDSKKFKTSPFSDFLTLDDLKEETSAPTTQTTEKKNSEVKFKKDKNDAGRSLFGSLKDRMAVSITRIIEKYPAAILVDANRPVSVNPYSAENIVYDNDLKTTQFVVQQSLFFNPFEVQLVTPKSNIQPTNNNEIRNLYSSFKKYVIDLSGSTYDIINYSEPNSVNKIVIKVKGQPFGSSTAFTSNFLIRPNDAVTEEFFNGLDDLEEILLNRETSPKYNAPFKIPADSSDGSKTVLSTVEYNWPISRDNWNLQIIGIDYDKYIQDLIDVADQIDDYKSNLFVRFITSPQLFEFDTEDKKMESVFQLYGQSFDNVKKYIDNIAYMRNVSYDGINNLPDILLKNLSNTLGLATNSLFDEKNLDQILYTRTDMQYGGVGIGKTLIEAEYEFYRRILVNLAFMYKSKGTRSCIEFFLKFIGAPEPMIKFDEYVYNVTSFPKSFTLDDDIYDVTLGIKRHITGVFDPINYIYDTVITTASTKFTRDGYPVEEGTGLPRAAFSESEDVFFAKGSGWYDITLDHRSPDILDTENSITTGRTKTLKTKSKGYTYGEDYFDVFRTLPGLDTGYELESDINNRKSEHVTNNSHFVLNRKNISLHLSSAQTVDYDIYRKSRNLELTFGSSTLYPQTGVTFAEFLQNTLSNQIKNSHTIKYKKNYIVLEDVFRDYITRTTYNPFHLIDVEFFINKMSPYWTQMIDQFIPATTQWTGGNLIENGIFGRPKYQYKLGCQPKEFTEDFYPDFITTIKEDLETIIGEEENFRGLINLTGITYYPVIEIDGTTYGGPNYVGLTSEMIVIVSGTSNTTYSAQLFDPFPMSGCTKLTSNDPENLALICEFKDYINPDLVKIKELWVDALTVLIEDINSIDTMDGPGCISTYAPYTAATATSSCPQIPKPKITYQIYTDVDCVEKIKFTSLKYGINDCSVTTYLDYKFISEYETTQPICDGEIDFYITPKIYSGGTEEGCILNEDLYFDLTNVVGIQQGDTNWPVYIYANCESNINESLILSSGRTIEYISGCTFKINDVLETDEIDLSILDAANCEINVKIKGLQLKAEHDPYDPQKSHYQEYYITSLDTSTSGITDAYTGTTWCDNYTGYSIVPNIQYRNGYDYGLKHDSKVLIISGTSSILTLINDETLTYTQLLNYITLGEVYTEDVINVQVGDILLGASLKDCKDLANYNFVNASISGYQFSYLYTKYEITDIKCTSSIKKSIITGLTVNNDYTVIEVLPTSKLTVYTNRIVNNGVVTNSNYFFDHRIPEYLQVRQDEPLEPCCDYPKDYYKYYHGDYLIDKDGFPIEVIAVDLNYCEFNLYFNFSNDIGGEYFEVFNGNDNNQVLLEHVYEEHNLTNISVDLQQYYVDEENCPDAPTIEELIRTGNTLCNTDPFSFISSWRTTNTGLTSSNYNQIKLPLESGGTYNFDVFWGDGGNNTITSWNQPEILHTYTNPGDYTVSITGTVIGWRFNNGGGNGIDKSKILNVHQWGPLNLGKTNSYFYGCDKLNLGLVTDILDLSGTTDMTNAFTNCATLTTVANMGSWNFSGVTATTKMFTGSTLFNENIGGWDTSNVKDMSYMFYSALTFNNQSSSSIGLWDVSNVIDMSDMFNNAIAFNQNLSSWDMSNVISTNRIFNSASSFDNLGNNGINNWNVAKVTGTTSMFASSPFNRPIGSWNMSAVTTTASMFQSNRLFNQNIGSWNTTKVTNMGTMFNGSWAFNNGGSPSISGWVTTGVTSMVTMFATALAFNQDIGNWDVSKVTAMSSMFSNAQSFNNGGSPSISAWTINSGLTNMGSMFSGAFTFNQPIGNWDVSKVTNMANMFQLASGFNKPLSGWNVGAVTNMTGMFNGAALFNQPIGDWNITGVTNLTSFMANKTPANYSTANYDDILTKWSAKNVKTGLTLNMGSVGTGIKYTITGQPGKSILTGLTGSGGKEWTITDGGI